MFTEATGIPVTRDVVKNRLARIRELAEIEEAVPVVSENEESFIFDEPPDRFMGLRQVFYDLETTNLSGLMGRLLCASFCDPWGNVITRTVTDFPQSSQLDDSGLAEWTRDEIERHDINIGWNNFNFDISFLNARLLRWGKRPVADRMSIDPMYKARYGRYGARIGSSKLDNVQKYFRTEDNKTPLDWDTWQLAGMGDEAAMGKVVEHCESDVRVLRAVFNHLKPLVRTIHR